MVPLLTHQECRVPVGNGLPCYQQSAYNIDHTVLGLVVQLYWRAARLHGGVAFKLDALH